MTRVPVTMEDFLIVLRAIEHRRGDTLKAMTMADVKEAQEFANLRAVTSGIRNAFAKHFTLAYWDRTLEI